MMVEEINKRVKKHRNWAVLGAVAGLVLIVGYFGYDMAMTPEQPVVQSAPASEIVAYINNERGMQKLADIEQRHFLDEWRDHLSTDAAAADALKANLETLDSDERKRFIEIMLRQFKRVIVGDARDYDRMSTEERNRLVHKRADEFEKQKTFTNKIAMALSAEVWSQDKLRRWVFDETTPAEREICMPYLDALQRVNEQNRNRRRNQPTTTAAIP